MKVTTVKTVAAIFVDACSSALKAVSTAFFMDISC
jgi:hypothetical protein